MSIDGTTAAQVAKKHGLSLSDSAALKVLSDSEEQANKLAAMFAADREADEASEIAAKIAEGGAL